MALNIILTECMETQTPEQTSSGGSSHKDTVLLLLAVALAFGGLFAFYFFNPELNVLVRTLILLGSLGAAVFIGYATAPGKELASYITGAYRIELRKVVWPSRQESLQATFMIAIVVVVFSLVLAGVDWLLNSGIKALIGGGA